MLYHYIVNMNTGKAFVKSKDLTEIQTYCKELQKLGHAVRIESIKTEVSRYE